MKQIAAGLVMASAVLALASSQERNQRRLDELHRHYELRVKEARKEGYEEGVRRTSNAPVVMERQPGLLYPQPQAPIEDAKPKGFRDRFSRS